MRAGLLAGVVWDRGCTGDPVLSPALKREGQGFFEPVEPCTGSPRIALERRDLGWGRGGGGVSDGAGEVPGWRSAVEPHPPTLPAAHAPPPPPHPQAAGRQPGQSQPRVWAMPNPGYVTGSADAMGGGGSPSCLLPTSLSPSAGRSRDWKGEPSTRSLTDRRNRQGDAQAAAEGSRKKSVASSGLCPARPGEEGAHAGLSPRPEQASEGRVGPQPAAQGQTSRRQPAQNHCLIKALLQARVGTPPVLPSLTGSSSPLTPGGPHNPEDTPGLTFCDTAPPPPVPLSQFTWAPAPSSLLCIKP